MISRVFRYELHPYQIDMVSFAFCRVALERSGFGWLADPGLGKTVCTLELVRLLRRHGLARRVLIIAPLDVIYSTWPDEIANWRYGYTHEIIHSPTNNTALNRRRQLHTPADIHLINPDGVEWLSTERGYRFDLTIIDESTKFKTWSAERTKALRSLKASKALGEIGILTGTPIPGGYQDLFPQAWFVDGGRALGHNMTYFREWACREVPGYSGYPDFEVRQDKTDEIEQRVAHMLMRVDAADHLDLPHVVDNVVEIELPRKARAIYDSVEADLFALLDSGEALTASNAGAKYTLCRQIANGGGYVDEGFDLNGRKIRRPIRVHSAKVDACETIVESLGGNPVMVAYQFNHDREKLLKRWPNAPAICADMPADVRRQTIKEWNEKRHRVLLVQPAALAHGANMQHGGADMIWFGYTNQLELFLQLKKRILRQGQPESHVRFHYLVARDTVDEAMAEAIDEKDVRQSRMLDALKRYRDRRK